MSKVLEKKKCIVSVKTSSFSEILAEEQRQVRKSI